MVVGEGLDLLMQELGFVLNSEQREALESLLGETMFFVSYQQVLTLFNCNNNYCSLSVGMFSFCKSMSVQFQTFAVHGKQTLLEKDSPSSRTMKS